MSRHGQCDIHHLYIPQFVSILHDYDFNLRSDVADVRGIRAKRCWLAFECIMQYLFVVLHMRRSSLCIAARANQFPKKATYGWTQLDELGRTNWNCKLFNSFRIVWQVFSKTQLINAIEKSNPKRKHLTKKCSI